MLTFMLVFFLLATSLLLRQLNSTTAHKQVDALTASALALAQAKEALIGRAATDENRPGSLTCPDIDNDGVADGDFGNCTKYVGRLPWKTLDVPELLDGNGERLWYALSAGIRDNPAAQPINPTKALELTLDSTTNVAAIVFSPGPPLPGQTGRPSNALADYLDGANNDGDPHYVSGPPTEAFNDKLLAITRDDVFRVVNQRILAEIRGADDNSAGAPTYGLRRYYAANGEFPWADSGNDGIGDSGVALGALPIKDLTINSDTLSWLNLNGWPQLINYQRLSGSLARLSIGNNMMDVSPCPKSPCQ